MKKNNKIDTEKWNYVNDKFPAYRIEQNYLKKFSEHDHCYRVLKSRHDSLFYAFENGDLLSEVGEKSYRSALRKHILPYLNLNVSKLEKTCAVATFDESWATQITEISLENLSEYLGQYFYDNIFQQYGRTDEGYQMHLIIDDWNQIPNEDRDSTRVNPHEITISKEHDVTLQELREENVDWFHNTWHPHYFINGRPVETYQNVERIFANGLVAGEQVTCERINPIAIMAESISNGETYTILKDSDKKKNYCENNPLEERISEELEKIRANQKKLAR